MIHADDLRLDYPTSDGLALDGVSFDVDRGDVLGVVGPVESGKTSLAMAIAGLAPDTTGGNLDGDLDVAGRDPRTADHDGTVGMVFEDYSSQLTQVRVIDEVTVPLFDRGFGREAARERARELLADVRLEGYAEKRTWDLSGGEQQRVAIASILATDPDVLVFDTATDMLDPEGREDVSNLIASLAGETTMVVTVDDPHELVGVADRALVLDGGEAVASGDADRVLRDADLFEDIGVRPPLPLRVARDAGLDADPLTPDELADALEATAGDGARGEHGVVGAADGGLSDDASDERELSEDPVLDVDDVSFAYGDEQAIDGVDLDVHGGEVHAIVGGNGAGKTTLSELLVGLLEPDDGDVRVDGESTVGSTASAVGESVAIAFQNPDEQLSRRTVEAELRFPLEQRQYDHSGWLPFSSEQRYADEWIDQRVDRAMELAGLGDDIRQKDPTKLPQGTRRLVAIASALAPDPAAAVLDEPTAGLDADGYERMRRTIERLVAQGKGVVVVEHDMDFVADVADTVTLLDDGEVVLQGPPSDVFARDNWDALRERYLRPPRSARLADRLGATTVASSTLFERTRALAETNP